MTCHQIFNMCYYLRRNCLPLQGTISQVYNGVYVTQSLVLFVVFCFPLLILFVLCLVAIPLHVLWIMASGYPLGLFKLFSIVFHSIGHVRFVHRTKINRKCVIIYHSWKALELISLWTKDIFRGQSFLSPDG